MPVEVKGVIELRKALRQFAPDLAKELGQEVGAALKPIVKKSRSYLPSNDEVISNWVGIQGRDQGYFPQYDAGIARRGVTFSLAPSKRNRRGFRSVATIYNKSAAGAIYETAGRKNSQGQAWDPKSGSKNFSHSLNPNAGKQFIDRANSTGQLKGQGKMRGRVIYRAWEEDQGRALASVVRAIEKAKRAFEIRSQV